MDRQQFYRTRLHEHLDANGDLAPPWAQFPSYERSTIGWRMGAGEDWLSYWHAFLASLAPAFEVRLDYLRRHPPAPMNWADHVYRVLHPTARDEEEEEEEDDDGEQAAAQRRAELLHMGLIASDAAYPTWLRQQHGVRWPWEFHEEPESAARYWTRELWFWSRQVAGLRSDPAWVPPPVPENWEPCVAPLGTGRVPTLDPRRGLLSLAQALAAGRVVPPWELGLDVIDFADSFKMDMGYVDAFRLWGMSAFDDREHMWCYLGAAIPTRWEGWIEDQFHLD